MLILVNGLPLFSKNLVRDLNAVDSKNTYIFVDTYYSYWGKIKFAILLPFCKGFISFNGVSTKSGSLDKVLQKNIPLIMYWHGTDVLKALEYKEKGQLYSHYIQKAVHFTDAPWLLEKIKPIVPNIELLPFKTLNVNTPNHDFEKLQVLTYVPQGKETFYGLPWLLEWAKENPSVPVIVIGTDGKDWSTTENVEYTGWISTEKAEELYRNSPIFVRLTQHDGNAFSVTQALAQGATVLWTLPHEKAVHVTSGDSFKKEMNTLLENQGDLLVRNKETMAYVRHEYDPKRVIPNFVQKIEEVLHEK